MLNYTSKFILLLLFAFQSADLVAQTISLTENQYLTVEDQVSDLIENYEIGLNNLGDGRDGVREKEYFVTDILQRVFVNEDALILNDLDPKNKETKSLKAHIYLNNIVTKYSKGAVFNFTQKKINGPYKLDSNHIFLKVSLLRTLKGTHINKPVSNKQGLDMYVSLETDNGKVVGAPKIYSITQHKENLNKFTPVPVNAEVENLQPLAINVPHENSVLIRGKIYPIKWDGPSGAVRIKLYKDGKFVRLLSDYVTGNTYYWEVSDTAKPGKYYNISISVYGDTAQGAVSESFTIRRKIPLIFKIIPLAGIAAAVIYYVSSGADQGSPVQGGLPLPPNPPD